MKTVLITGTSSGIGKAAVIEFANAGWNVAATMRNPEAFIEFSQLPNVKLYALDVTNTESISTAMNQVKADFGSLDVVVNNAGFGVDGVFEAMSDEVIQKQFDTNVFGLMRVTREAIKIMRTQPGGSIVQIASMGGRLAFPLYSIYHASKWAVEGFTESLQYEVMPFNIRLKIVEPGAIKTEFYGRGRQFVKPENSDVYDDFIAKVEKVSMEAGAKGEDPSLVAKTIVKAAADQSAKLRFPIGAPAPMLLFLRKLLPETLFFGIVKSSYKI
jgi:NAD(P)-dependent dehydrogenase (short-subunit alcohol dehydrogenase family)